MPPLKRDGDPSSGVLDPHDINNAGFFFLFALIGVAFVLTGIWFFFWARDGGFYFHNNDWDDYKSTVLRRRGPNGTILSNATRSTKLGGGSVFNKAYDMDTRTEVTESTAMSGITAGPSDIYAREKREEKRRQREAERRKKRANKEKKTKTKTKTRGMDGGDEDEEGKEMLGVVDEEAEKMAREQLRNYREERPARVGGLNARADGSEWEGSTNAGESRSTLSLSGISSAPTATEAASSGSGSGSGVGASRPTAAAATRSGGGGIRKVYSVADRTTARENERLRAEARKMREEGRTAARREHRFQRAIAPASASEMSESLLSGSGTGSGLGSGGGGGGRSVMDAEGSDVGTKSYHHPMPELREHRRRERDREREREREGGRTRRGYQRGNTRDEELEEEVD